MRNALAILAMIVISASVSFGQAAAGKPATSAKPATAAPATATTAKPTAIIDTAAGKMTCTLFPDKAPIGVANFIGLASGTKDWKNPVSGATKHGVPLYDGLIFHRVIPQFMIQGGDPAGTGSGADPVAPFKNEVSPDLLFDQPGRLAYANAGPNTNASQFFITEVAFTGQQASMLNGKYTIFGVVVEGLDVVSKINHIPVRGDKPVTPVKLIAVTIERVGPEPPPKKKKPLP